MNPILFLLGVCASLVCTSCTSQATETYLFREEGGAYVYGISKWPFGKNKAICFTWDDGLEKQMPILMNVFNQNGYKTTFAVPTSKFKRKVNYYYQKANEKGHEIASHTVHHAVLTGIPLDSARYEIEQSARDIINTFGFVPVTFCHPYRMYNSSIDSIVLRSFYTSRFSSILKYPNRQVHTVLSSDTYDRLVEELDAFMQSNNDWMLYSGHGLSSNVIGTKGVYQPIDSIAFDNYLKYIRNNYDNQVYVETYDNIVFAELLRNNVSLEYGEKVIHIKTEKVASILKRYQRPSAYVTLLFDPKACDVKISKEIIDKRILGEKLCITVDLRKGEYIYLR